VNTQQVMIAMLLLGGLALWYFGGDDRPAPPATQAQRPPPYPPALAPRRAPPPEPRHDYAPPATAWDPAPLGRSEPRAPADPWAGPGGDGFRFRPLNDSDRRRGAPRAAPTPAPRMAAPYAPRDQGGYRFRPETPRPGGASRYQAPYPGPGGTEPEPLDHWVEQWDPPPGPRPPAPPAWEAPANRMLPSLDWPSDRTFTAR
jgi:hypothetical protein